MIFHQKDQIWQFEKTPPGLLHGITTRHSFGFQDYNLTSKEPDIAKKSLYRKILSNNYCQGKPLVFPRQVSGHDIWIVSQQTEPPVEADALITNRTDIALGVLTADCVPLILFDTEKKILAMVHAGWRGTVDQIARKTVETMKQQFKCNPLKMYAAIGPSIGPEVYEVGHEVIAIFNTLNYPTPFWKPKPNGKFLLDLWSANHYQLEYSGIPTENIEIAQICTHSNPMFYSARRDSVHTGRFATVAAVV
jgi:hypothetical protein